MKAEAPVSNFKDFIPFIAVVALIVFLTLLRQWQYGPDFFSAMHDFMGIFFLAFGAFKIIDWKGFVESYRVYDILAKRSKFYAYLYPLIEIALGLAYLLRFNLVATNSITLIVMGISTIGVAQALLFKKRIACACLGSVFKIPMTKVTLIENVLMFVMALGMLVHFK